MGVGIRPLCLDIGERAEGLSMSRKEGLMCLEEGSPPRLDLTNRANVERERACSAHKPAPRQNLLLSSPPGPEDGRLSRQGLPATDLDSLMSQ